MPIRELAPPASTTPVTLPGGAMSKTSSRNPVVNTTSAASTIPIGTEVSAKSASNEPSDTATISATTKPASIASPPTCGIGEVCTDRSFGS